MSRNTDKYIIRTSSGPMRTTGQVGTASGSIRTTGRVDKGDRAGGYGRVDKGDGTGRVDKYDGRSVILFTMSAEIHDPTRQMQKLTTHCKPTRHNFNHLQ